MSDQALKDLKTILDSLSLGMSLRLDRAAFARVFGEGAASKPTAKELASQCDCTLHIEEKGSDLSVEFMRRSDA